MFSRMEDSVVCETQSGSCSRKYYIIVDSGYDPVENITDIELELLDNAYTVSYK